MSEAFCQEEYLLQVTNVPFGYHLLKIGNRLENLIGFENAITSICWKKELSDQESSCSIEVKLRNKRDAEILLQKGEFAVCFKEKSYSLKVTKPRSTKLQQHDPKTSEEAVNQDNNKETDDNLQIFEGYKIKDIQSATNLLSTISQNKENKDENLQSEFRFEACFSLPFSLKLWKYMNRSNDLLEKLKKFFPQYILVSRNSNNQSSSCKLKFTSTNELKNQNQLRGMCEELLEKFSAEYVTESFLSFPDVITHLRNNCKFTQPEYWKSEGKYPIFFEFDFVDNSNCILVTGNVQVVEVVMNHLKLSELNFLDKKLDEKNLADDFDAKSFSSSSVRLFELQVKLPNSSKTLELLGRNDDVLKMLNDYCQSFLSVTRVGSNNPSSYILRFTSLQDEMNTMSESKFESYCNSALQSFLARFSTRRCTRSRSLMKQMKEHQLSDVWSCSASGKSCKIYLEWNLYDDPSYVFITGEAAAVENFVEFFEKEFQLLSCNESTTSNTAPDEVDVKADYDFHKQQNWDKLLETDSDLFTKVNQRCVLVRNLSADLGFSEVQNFFEEKVKGKVERILHFPDGYLIAFKDKSSVKNALDLEQPLLNEDELEIVEKHIPSPNNRILRVKGELTSEYVDSIMNCGSAAKSEFEVQQISPKNFLVVFQEEQLDLIQVKNECNKHKLGFRFKVSRLCHSDCVIVKKCGSFSVDSIKLALMKKKYQVTAVLSKSDNLFLFLSNYRDVPKLLDETISIDNTPLEMLYFFPDVGELTKKQYQAFAKASIQAGPKSTGKFQPKPFSHQFTAHEDLVTLILNSKLSRDDLNDKLIGVARVDFKRKNRCLEGRFTPVASQKEFIRNQTQFEKKSFEITKDFLNKFIFQNPKHFQPEAAERIKQISYNKKSHSSLIESNNLYVFIKWEKDNARPNASVTGLYKHINELLKLYEDYHTIFNCTESDYKILSSCGVIEKVQKQHFVKISICGNGFNLYVEGTKTDVTKAEETLQTEQKEIQSESDFGFLQETQKNFLYLSLKSETLEKEIQELFLKKKIQAFLQLKNSPKLYFKPESCSKSKELLIEIIQVKQYLLQDDADELFKDSSWSKFQNFTESSELISHQRKNEFITLVGLSPDFEKAEQLLQKVLSLADDKEMVVKMGKPQQAYISLFSYKIDMNFTLERIDWSSVADGIRLSGKQKLINSAKECLETTVASLEIGSRKFDEPWQIKYLNSNAGKQILETLQSKYQCVIMAESTTNPVMEPRDTSLSQVSRPNFGASMNRQTPQNAVVIIPGTNVTVKVVQSNIIEHRVDAIVNTSNEELELRDAGVSGSIKRQGGIQIQIEMNKMRENFKSKRLFPGRAVTTNAGNLRNCKKIIHVAGPMWYRYSSKREAASLLKESTRSCLEQAELFNVTSIAIPAISCGVFGGEPGLTAKLIVETIVEYFQKNKNSIIKKIDLIELSNVQVIKGFIYELHLLTSTTFPSHSNTYSHLKEKDRQPTGSGSFAVVVEEGNALLSKADVLVNTAGPSFQLSQSKLSKMVLKEGGPDVEIQCEQHPMVQNKRFRIAKSGNLPFKFLAHLAIDVNNLHWISDDLFHIFKELDKLLLTSVVLPAIGTGIAAHRVEHCVQWIKRGIEKFQQTDPMYLRTIKVVIFDHKHVSKFQSLQTKKEESSPSQKTSPLNKALPSAGILSPASSESFSSDRREIFRLVFCSKSKEINAKVEEAIDWKLEGKFCEKKINIVSLTANIEERLKTYQKTHFVGIKHKENQNILVYGLQEDVKKACEKITNLIDLK